MKTSNLIRKPFVLNSLILLMLSVPFAAFAADDLTELRQQLAEQQALIQAQQKQLELQTQQLQQMSRRLDELAAGKSEASPQVATSPVTAPAATATKPQAAAPWATRDSIGDLNSDAVKAGDFPFSFKIPGTKDVSLSIDGFIKTVAITDSDAETMGADFLPATLGIKRNDKDGATSIDSTLTRLILDVRAPAKRGNLRGYVESDLNSANDGNLDLKMRHAYGAWNYDNYTLVAGHTWSTLMDLKILPEGLTEPTVSGAIFVRQPQVRLSRSFENGFTLDAAIEDPSSADVFDGSNNPEKNNTKLPDVVLGVEYGSKGIGHLRLGGILRDLEVDLPAGGDDSELAWGLSLTGHLEVLESDKLTFGGAYGQGLGRYLLGIQSTAGSVIDPVDEELELRDNWGGFVTYAHHWNDILRSSAMVGYAKSDPLGWQKGAIFESSTYAALNLMWQVLPYLTIGTEYAYGQRENEDGSDLDNHRIAVGFQFY